MNPNRNFSEIMHNTHDECQLCMKGDKCSVCPNRNVVSYRTFESIDKEPRSLLG